MLQVFHQVIARFIHDLFQIGARKKTPNEVVEIMVHKRFNWFDVPCAITILTKEWFPTYVRFRGKSIAAKPIVCWNEGPPFEQRLVGTMACGANGICRCATVQVKLGKCLLDVLRHLRDYVLMIRSHATSWLGKGKIDNKIKETHNKIPVPTTDTYDNTAEDAQKNGDLSDRIKVLNGQHEMVR